MSLRSVFLKHPVMFGDSFEKIRSSSCLSNMIWTTSSVCSLWRGQFRGLFYPCSFGYVSLPWYTCLGSVARCWCSQSPFASLQHYSSWKFSHFQPNHKRRRWRHGQDGEHQDRQLVRFWSWKCNGIGNCVGLILWPQNGDCLDLMLELVTVFFFGIKNVDYWGK